MLNLGLPIFYLNHILIIQPNKSHLLFPYRTPSGLSIGIIIKMKFYFNKLA